MVTYTTADRMPRTVLDSLETIRGQSSVLVPSPYGSEPSGHRKAPLIEARRPCVQPPCCSQSPGRIRPHAAPV